MPSSNHLTASHFGLAGLLFLAVFLQPAWAADKDPAKAAKDQVRRLQEQKRGLEMEKNQLLLEKGDMAKKLEIAEGELGKKKVIENRLLDTQRRLRISSDMVEKLKAEVIELTSQVGASVSEVTKLNSQVDVEKIGRGRVEKNLDACTVKNQAIYRQGRELLQAFARGGVCDAVSGEPLLGLNSVSQENSLEVARDDLEAQRYQEVGAN